VRSLPLPDATRRLGAPAGWDHGTDGICHTIEIRDADGFMTSLWEFTEKERARVVAGAPFILHIQGNVHPVVALAVGDAPEPA
jgi:hypothetical protein